jgi:hypothetical protein
MALEPAQFSCHTDRITRRPLVHPMFTAVRTFVFRHWEESAVLASSGLFLATVYVLTVVLY